ncbi:MAG: hypothetical protein IKO64_01795 [Kiritimatiellae bacterium]|nr:hypothetical protein [Kiritimatiellia bacterium]
MFAIESENIVGYQKIEVGTGYSSFTPTFKDVQGGELYLSSIVPTRTLSDSYATTGKNNTCKGKILVQLLSGGGDYSEVYYFYSTDPNNGTNYNKWYKLVGQTLTEIGETEVTIPAGIGFAVNNITGNVSYFQVSGSVDLVCQNVAATGYSMMGNSTPVDMYLTEITPMRSATEGYATAGKNNTCKGKILVQLLTANGDYSEVYYFYSTDPNNGTNYNKWYKLVGQTLTEVEATEVLLPAGTGFAVNNITGAPSYLQLKKPL